MEGRIREAIVRNLLPGRIGKQRNIFRFISVINGFIRGCTASQRVPVSHLLSVQGWQAEVNRGSCAAPRATSFVTSPLS
jgi:hypothetical protein